MDWFMGKSRRKEKDSSPVTGEGESLPYLEDDYIAETIIDADFESLVKLPPGLDYNEWLATHTICFFEHINLIYGIVSEYCTTSGCSSMTGLGNVQYLWVDEKGKKSKCAAPQYVDYVMSFTQNTIHDEGLFPTKYGNAFPSSFVASMRKIHRLLLHVLGHVYAGHYELLAQLRLQSHLHAVLRHFMTFNATFALVDAADTDAAPLDELYHRLLEARGRGREGGGEEEGEEGGTAAAVKGQAPG